MIGVHRVSAPAMTERTVEVVRGWLEDGTPPAQVAVLARVNSALLPVQVALGEAGIPRTTPLDATVLGRTGIRTALAYLRLGLDPERMRREDLMETLRRPSRKLVGAVQPLLRRSGSWSRNRLGAVADTLEGRYADRFADYLADLDVLTDSITDGADTVRCLTLIRDRIGLGEAMATLDSSRTRPEGSSHGDDLDALLQLGALHPDPVTYREWLVDRLREEGDPDGVVLSTVHRVKGMEWDRVVVFAANAGLMPHRLADDTEEERRVLHVAVTRGRDHTVVVANRDAPSPFLDELHRPAASRDDAAADDEVPARPATRTDDGGIVAERGAVVTLAGGFTGTIVDLHGGHATVRLEQGVDVHVPMGEPVTVDGQPGTLTRPRPARTLAGLAGRTTDVPGDPADEVLFEELRGWRTRTASAQAVPPYVVLHDQHLRAIAAARPRSLTELSACPGIGPTKLDRYGDEILTVVADHAPTPD